MRRVIQISFFIILCGSMASLLPGCGSSNNDQGMSFTAIGYNGYEDKEDEDNARVCDPEVFTSGTSIPISFGTTPEGLLLQQAIYGCINLQNNMTTQFIRVDRVFHEFYIEGASVQPPSSSAPLSIVLGPVKVESENDSRGLNDSPESSLSPGFQAANMVSAGFIAVPVEVTTWLALNRASLPEPPFTMAVTHYVTGVTSSGDRLETNKLTLFVVVTPDVIITPETANPEVTATPEPEATTGANTEANTGSEPEAYGS